MKSRSPPRRSVMQFSQTPKVTTSTIAAVAVTFTLVLWFLTSSTTSIEIEESKRFDSDANLVRLDFSKDKNVDPRQGGKGWMLDPLKVQEQVGLKGGATSCIDVHLGQILPGKMRGNHRHNYCNETIIMWGAKMRYRVENPAASQKYTEVILSESDVAVVAGPSHLAHAIVNLDKKRTVYLLACQDASYQKDNPLTDYGVWKDL